jgi:hypothetical protein
MHSQIKWLARLTVFMTMQRFRPNGRQKMRDPRMAGFKIRANWLARRFLIDHLSAKFPFAVAVRTKPKSATIRSGTIFKQKKPEANFLAVLWVNRMPN